ncbi:MAG: hypothetical protein HY553_10655, partial [Elusimicrobia bacterium]|nr:hypothetical protein [Elusimicrobiota bacterium]
MTPRLSLALALWLAALPALGQTRIAIHVEVPAGSVASAAAPKPAVPVASVTLPPMGLGNQAVPLKFGPPKTLLTEKLGEVRIRGVAVAPAARTGRAALAGAKPGEAPRPAGELPLAGVAAEGANRHARGLSAPQGRDAGAGGGLQL